MAAVYVFDLPIAGSKKRDAFKHRAFHPYSESTACTHPNGKIQKIQKKEVKQ